MYFRSKFQIDDAQIEKILSDTSYEFAAHIFVDVVALDKDWASAAGEH